MPCTPSAPPADMPVRGAMPLVTIVIPAHNRAHMLRRAIDSALAQTYAGIEVIVVDDASTDNTAEVVGAYDDPRLRYVRHVQNEGGGGARNTGIELARGEYVAFLDSDDEWRPEKIERQVEALHPLGEPYGMVLTGWSHDELRDGELVWVDAGADAHGDVSSPAVLLHLHENLITVMVRTSVAREIGGFDASFVSGEELDFFARLAQRCWVTSVPDPLLVSYRCHGGGITADPRRLMHGRLQLIAKQGAWLQASGRLGYWHWEAMRYASKAGEVRVACRSLADCVRATSAPERLRVAAKGSLYVLAGVFGVHRLVAARRARAYRRLTALGHAAASPLRHGAVPGR